MNAYIAYGTQDFLQELYDKELKSGQNAFFLALNDDAVLIVESEEPNPFNEENTYKVIDTHNIPSKNEFVVIQHILTTDEAAPLVESQLKKILLQAKKEANGFQASRIYKPINAEKYILLTAWKSQNDFLLWNSSDIAKEFSNFIDGEETAPQSLLEGGSFSKSYFVIS